MGRRRGNASIPLISEKENRAECCDYMQAKKRCKANIVKRSQCFEASHKMFVHYIDPAFILTHLKRVSASLTLTTAFAQVFSHACDILYTGARTHNLHMYI